ncbi:MAG: FAD-dependent oxidoreductase [Clostridiales bacterium]|jgi:hypothetical protein|nr:FAD-dependent oxidoreductase [Clostridiales bacterium]
MRNFERLIIGADAAGIGAACSARSRNTLLVDRGIVCGHDFTAAYKAYPLAYAERPSAEGSELLYGLRKANLICGGKVSVPAASGVLAGLLLKSGCRVMFMTEVVGIEYSGGAYRVTLFSNDGFETVHAAEIIDVTAQGTLHDGAGKVRIDRYCNALLTRLLETKEPRPSDFYTLYNCRFPSEYVYGIRVLDGEEYGGARRRLHETWRAHHKGALRGFEFAALASEFMYAFPDAGKDGYSAKISERRIWHPSPSHGDLLSAFEGGARLCRRK